MTTDEKDIDIQPIPTDAYKDADAALDSSVDKDSEEAPTLKEVIKSKRVKKKHLYRETLL